ncbi:MAG TPA: FAD-dependent oxidoreductase [Methylomirabilota bacterium]|jgi:mycofactocin system FadH/OYE family oxidoreductase 2|nr:FAD-dependent oxidoreductase [Methylomirabilota bacterium]
MVSGAGGVGERLDPVARQPPVVYAGGAMGDTPFARLFSPVKLGHLTARNRIVSTPHGAAFGEKGGITDRYVRYHEEKAKGGCGVVMMFGSSSVHPTSVNDWGEVNNWDDGVIPQFQTMSEAIHRHGALCLSQISHRGRRGHSWYSGVPLWAPSDTREERHREWPHVMTRREIREVIDAWAAAAVRLKRGGFDGCDLPFYGGHLVENFLSPLSNTRTDEYGGTFDNRLRLALEVVRAVREAVGRDFVVGIRHTGDQLVPGGLTREDQLEVARRIDALGMVDYFMVSGSSTETLRYEAMVTPSLYHPRGLYNELAAGTRRVVRVPVIVSGRIITPEQAEAALASGICDLVGMARSLIADPELPRKAAEGRLDDIRMCVGASEGCIGRLRQGKAITCVQNPMIGREAELAEIRPAARAKRVVVVGGGVGGLEAARVAALRGHRVLLFEATSALGGQVLAAAGAPKREDYAGIAAWLARQVEKLGVEVRLGTSATAAGVLAEAPDAVIVATGATPRVPDIPGAHLAHVVSPVDVLLGRVTPGRRSVVVDEDGHFAGPTTADFLASRGGQVTIVCRYFMVGEDIDEGLRADLYARLYGQGVTLLPLTVAVEILPEAVRVRHTFSAAETELEAQTVVLAFGGKADDALFHELAGQVPELRLVGDAYSPRRIHDAILDGTRAARAI